MHSLTHAIGSIFQPLLDAVGWLLSTFFSIIPNYPIDVALLTLVIMALITPLTVKATKNMAAMQALGPEMKKLQVKYKGAENRTLLNEEMMKLYKEHNVNPASGCLPMLLQMPAFFILYSVIKGLTNTVNKGVALPYSYVGNTFNPNGSSKCEQATCALPRYVSTNTSMYQHIVEADGKLQSFGLDFSQRLLSHHSAVWLYIPYGLLVAAAVGLQFLQMSRLNSRNPQAAQANPQMASMQKYMPLIFGLIYLNVAALLNVYFVVSAAVRILTQEILFRKGLTQAPIPQKAIDTKERVVPKPKTTAGSKAPTAGTSNGKGKSNNADDTSPASTDESSVAKPHPRSKAKKERKPRAGQSTETE